MDSYAEWLARLGRAVRQVRLQRGLSQFEFAARVGIEQSNVSRFERGLQGFDSATLHRMCVALEISASALFGLADHGDYQRQAMHRALLQMQRTIERYLHDAEGDSLHGTENEPVSAGQ